MYHCSQRIEENVNNLIALITEMKFTSRKIEVVVDFHSFITNSSLLKIRDKTCIWYLLWYF